MVEEQEQLGGRWIVPKAASEGDLLFLLCGSFFPIVMRRTEERDRYRWIGPGVWPYYSRGNYDYLRVVKHFRDRLGGRIRWESMVEKHPRPLVIV